MKVRAWQELHEGLTRASQRYNVSMSNIGRKACRKFNRLNVAPERVEVLKFKEPSTYGGQEMDFNIPSLLLGEKTASDLRKILVWYLAEQKEKERPALPLELDDYKGMIEIVTEKEYARKR